MDLIKADSFLNVKMEIAIFFNGKTKMIQNQGVYLQIIIFFE